MQYVITYGRLEGNATKKAHPRSRGAALKLANNLAFVFFMQHPFKYSETKGTVRYEGNGFYVEYEETQGSSIFTDPATCRDIH